MDDPHIECGRGWAGLYENLIVACHKEGVDVLQVKEKFGGLRFYALGVSEELDGLIDEAERQSFFVCEQCGEPGILRGGSWLKTCCDAHANGRPSLESRSKELPDSNLTRGRIMKIVDAIFEFLLLFVAACLVASVALADEANFTAPVASRPLTAIAVTTCGKAVALFIQLDATHLLRADPRQSDLFVATSDGKMSQQTTGPIPWDRAYALAQSAVITTHVVLPCTDGVTT